MKPRTNRRSECFFEFGPFWADPVDRSLLRDGEPVPLTSKAFDTLMVLLESEGRILDKDYLMSAVWPDAIVEENNLNQTISAIRKALGPSSVGKAYIETVHRRGYRFAVPVTRRIDRPIPIDRKFEVPANGTAKNGQEQSESGPHPETMVASLPETLPSERTASVLTVAGKLGWLRRNRFSAVAAVVILVAFTVGIALARRKLQSRVPEAPAGVPALAQGKFLAVLPFQVVGDQASLDYVAQGLAGELASSLLQLQGLHVASATAVEHTDPNLPLERTARQLGANLLVRGTVQGNAQEIVVLASLEDVADGRRIWSGEFSGASRDVVGLEDQLYRKIAAALGLEAAQPQAEGASGHSTDNFEAYDLFLKGNEAMRHRDTVKSVEAAVAFYQKALKKDAGFALGYAGLANASVEMYRQKKDAFWAEKALRSAQQAVRLSDELAEVHFALGNVYEATGKTQEAIAEEKRGLELAPNSDEGYRHLAHALLDSGNKDEALRAYQAAVRIDPYYWFNYNTLGYAYFRLGRFGDALIAFQQVIQMEPDNAYGYDNVGAVYISQGKWRESIPFFERALQLQPDLTAYSNLGTAYFHLKRYDDAARMFEKAVEISPKEQIVLGNLADAYRWSGQSQKAVSTYDKAIALAYEDLQTNPRDAAAMQALALYYAKKGNTDEALAFIGRARALDSANVQFMYSEAQVKTLVGQTNEALTALSQALQKGYSPEEATVDPELNKLRSDPSFDRLIESAKRHKS